MIEYLGEGCYKDGTQEELAASTNYLLVSRAPNKMVFIDKSEDLKMTFTRRVPSKKEDGA